MWYERLRQADPGDYLYSIFIRLLPIRNEPLIRYATLRVAQAPRKPGVFSPPPTSNETASYPFRHVSRHVHGARVVMHVGIAYPRWRGTFPACTTRNFAYLVRRQWWCGSYAPCNLPHQNRFSARSKTGFVPTPNQLLQNRPCACSKTSFVPSLNLLH